MGCGLTKGLSYFETPLVRKVLSTYTRLTAVDGSGERFPLLLQKQTLADFVAWCGDRLPDNCDELLARVTGW